MATKIPIPLIHVYKEVNIGKYKSVKHFELVTTQSDNPVLPNKINISKDRSFAKSSPQYWLKIWNGNKWSEWITGLFKTDVRFTYWGDQNNRQNLLIFKFSNDAETLTVFCFQNYFTRDLRMVFQSIDASVQQKKEGVQNPLICLNVGIRGNVIPMNKYKKLYFDGLC